MFWSARVRAPLKEQNKGARGRVAQRLYKTLESFLEDRQNSLWKLFEVVLVRASHQKFLNQTNKGARVQNGGGGKAHIRESK